MGGLAENVRTREGDKLGEVGTAEDGTRRGAEDRTGTVGRAGETTDNQLPSSYRLDKKYILLKSIHRSDMQEIQYLQVHRKTFREHISACYPLTEEFIDKNKEHLDWFFLSLNKNLPWSIDFIEKFIDLWSWVCLSGNESLPWSDDLIIHFADKWNWSSDEDGYEPCLYNNNAIKWTIPILYRYPERISGSMLSQDTELINGNPQILEDFKDILWWDYISGNEYMDWSEELMDRYLLHWNWEILSANRAVGWNERMIYKYKDKYNPKYVEGGYNEQWINHQREALESLTETEEDNHIKFTIEEFEEELQESTFSYFSFDKRVPWSIELIAKYEDSWYWSNLSLNEYLPWSDELIDRFKDRWDFGRMQVEPDGTQAYYSGLSNNDCIPWSFDLIKRYESKWEWLGLTYSETIPWSVKILQEFEEHWVWNEIIWNLTMWRRVFYPYLDNEIISELIKRDE